MGTSVGSVKLTSPKSPRDTRKIIRRLRRRGISSAELSNHAQQLRPRAQFLLIDERCRFVRWIEYEDIIPTMKAAHLGLYLLEVQR